MNSHCTAGSGWVIKSLSAAIRRMGFCYSEKTAPLSCLRRNILNVEDRTHHSVFSCILKRILVDRNGKFDVGVDNFDELIFPNCDVPTCETAYIFRKRNIRPIAVESIENETQKPNVYNSKNCSSH